MLQAREKIAQIVLESQDMYGMRYTFLDAVHGFVATASALIQGRHLLDASEWAAWEKRIADTIRQTAEFDGSHANWRAQLSSARLRDAPPRRGRAPSQPRQKAQTLRAFRAHSRSAAWATSGPQPHSPTGTPGSG